MAATTEEPQEKITLLHFIHESFENATGLSCYVATFTDALVKFEFSMDALVFTTVLLSLDEPSPSVNDMVARAAVVGAAHGQALRACASVSRLRGFSFAENPLFWSNALAPSFLYALDSLLLHVSPRVASSFPQVVVRIRLDGSLGAKEPETIHEGLKKYLHALFVPPLADGTPQEKTTRENRHTVCEIESTLEFDCFPKNGTLFYGLLDSIRQIIDHTNTHNWTDEGIAVRIKHLRFPETPIRVMEDWGHIDDVWPPHCLLTVEDPMQQGGSLEIPAMRLYVVRVLGLEFSQWAGRLEFLDLTECMESEYAELVGHVCSLIPYSRTLRVLKLNACDARDWLWLAYAMFHPRSQHSKWRKLVLCHGFMGDRDHDLMQAMIASPTGWEILKDEVAMANPVPVPVPVVVPWQQSPLTGDYWQLMRTAKTLRKTTMRSAVGFDERPQNVPVAAATRVEICDLTCALRALPVTVSVILPGYGMLLVDKNDLTAVEETRVYGAPRSCITSVEEAHVSSAQFDVINKFFDVMRPWLEHVRLGPNGFLDATLALLLPCVRTLTNCTAVASTCTALADKTMLSYLECLELNCGEKHIDELFLALLGRTGRGPTGACSSLKKLRLRVSLFNDDPVERLLPHLKTW